VARKKVPAERSCAQQGLAGILVDVSPRVADTVDLADECRPGIAAILLKLLHDGRRDGRKGLLGADEQPDALSHHLLHDFGRPRIRRGHVAKGAVEERLRLRRHAIPINRSRKDESLCRQEEVKEHAAEVVLDGAFAVPSAAGPAVTQKAGQHVVCVNEIAGMTCVGQAPGGRGGQQSGISVSSRTSAQNDGFHGDVPFVLPTSAILAYEHREASTHLLVTD